MTEASTEAPPEPEPHTDRHPDREAQRRARHVRRHGAHAKRRDGPRLRWWREVLYILVFYGVYSFIRNEGVATESKLEAFRNARQVIRIERLLGTFHEETIQDWFLPWRAFISFWNVFYGTAHFVVTIFALVYLFRRMTHRYPLWRNTLACTTGLALIGFAFYPLMPPRLLPAGYGFVDTLKVIGGLWSFDSGAVAKVSNQYAAMPSLHFAWSTWCTLVLLPACRRRSTRALALSYPFLTLFAIVVTANHFWIDAAGGALVLATGFLMGRTLTRLLHHHHHHEPADEVPAPAAMERGSQAATVAEPERQPDPTAMEAGEGQVPEEPPWRSDPSAGGHAVAASGEAPSEAPRRLEPLIVPTPPASLAPIATRVNACIDRLLSDEVSRWAEVDPDLVDPLAVMRELVMAGGKRLRPAFCHWAFVGAGGDPGDPLVENAGAALELLHTFALIHDDVMDGSPRRRGLQTVHLRFEGRHAGAAWRGEGRRFGEGVAILVGDLAFVYADHLLRGAPQPALDVFTELRLEVNVGQYLDLLGTVRGEVSLGQARRICRYKSGKYTIERPLHLGAALAGRLDELAGPLSAYGDPLGEAFQLRDDLLGAFGDTSLTGKPVGEDLREGKPTALFAFAAAAAAADDRHAGAAKLLADRFGAADLTDAEVAELQTVLVETGARAEVEAAIDQLVSRSLEALAGAPLDEEAKRELQELAHFVGGRDH
ncbi:MAG TPA: polyprenyl synthetase family protein [Acidimicrobiales bacterium]|nr:polyprenyl synthetase family protein [Acidimicrobiales bacterium]